jgi:transposase
MSKKHETRQKAQCVLLSNKGFSINELVVFFDVHLNTIYNWLDSWDNEGILSLYHKKGQGRKPLLVNIKKDEIRNLVIENPKQLKKVISQIAEKHEVKISKRTLIRYVKKNSI